MNKSANIIVMIVPYTAAFLLPWIRPWCAQVINAPLLNSRTVFNKGTAKGSKATIPIGGHVLPMAISGARLE